MLEALLADRRRGAVAIALDAAELLARLSPAERAAAAARLVDAHPAMAPLRLLSRADDPAAFADALRAHMDEAVGRAAGVVAGRRVLTISHSSVVEQALRSGRAAEIHCLRSEPGGEGAALAARLGAHLWEDAQLDEAAAAADVGLVGADAVGLDSFVNKVGTAALCRALPTWMIDVPEKRLAPDEFAECAAALGDLFEVVPLDLVRRP